MACLRFATAFTDRPPYNDPTKGGKAVTVVYVDSVFLLNGLMDYFLLLATAHLAGIPIHRGRYVLAALLGGGYAVAVFLPGLEGLAALPGKLAAGGLMALAAYGGDRKLPRLTLLLFLVSCGFAGCVLCLGLMAGGVPMQNGIFYTDVDARVLLMAAGAAYLVLSVVFKTAARHGVRGTLVPVTLALGDRRVRLTALCDTGNGLRDPATGRPLLVAWNDCLGSLWPPELKPLLTDRALENPAEILRRSGLWQTRLRLVPYSAVGVHAGLLLAVRTDWGEIGGRRYDRLLVALSPTELGSGFGALWGEMERGVKDEDFTETSGKAAGAAGAAGTSRGPLHRRQRHAAASAVPGAGGGAGDPHWRAGGPADAD